MDFFGLDIGSHNLKVVQLKRAQDKYQLVALGSAPSPPKGLASEAESDLTVLAEAIKRLHQEAKITTKNVATTLPEDQVFTRVITLPKLTDEELTSALKWEAEQYVPIPLTEVTLAHQIIGGVNQNKEKIEVLLVAAPKRLIDKLLRVLKTAGLSPVSLETEILAMSRSLAAPEDEGILLVDLGARATDIAIVEKQQVVFTRSIMTAGEALTRAVAGSLGLEILQAEEYKKAYGVDPGKLEGKVSKAIAPIFEVIIKEMEQAIQFYQSEKKDRVIKRIVLTGGTAILPEIVSLIAKKLNIETQIGDPFSQIFKDNLLTKIPESDLPFYAVAVGLAMKEI